MGDDTKHIIKARKYKVSDGDSLKSIADSAGITWQELTKFNFQTEDPDEVNIALRDQVGCRKKTKDGYNYVFTSDDDPGIIYIPEEMPENSYPSSTTHTINVTPPDEYTYSPSDCCVNFRPKTGWKGEYGFDWMRNGDFPIADAPHIGDEKYEDIVGNMLDIQRPGCLGWLTGKKYSETLIADGNETGKGEDFRKSDLKLRELEEKEYKKNYLYDSLITYSDGTQIQNFTSFLSIYINEDDLKPPQHVDIMAQLFVQNSPERIKFEYDPLTGSSAPTPLTITPAEPDKLVKPTRVKTNLKIECTAPIESDIIIKAKSVFRDTSGITQEQVVGQLVVMANSKEKRGEKNIVLITVTLPARTKRGELSPSLDPTLNAANQQAFIARTLHQALVTPKFHSETLDLTKETDLDQFDIDKYEKSLVAYKPGNKTYEDLAVYCYRKLKAQIALASPGSENKYDGSDCIKAFYFKVDIGNAAVGKDYQPLNGYQTTVGGNLFVVMSGSAIESTPVHEFLHALGLPHTFDNGVGKKGVSANAKYTYKAMRTENIMDYTHTRQDGDYSKARIGLWHWQWEIANGNAAREGSDDLAPVNL